MITKYIRLLKRQNRQIALGMFVWLALSAVLLSGIGAGGRIGSVAAQDPDDWNWEHTQAAALREAGLLTDLDLSQTIQFDAEGADPQTVTIALHWAYADIGQVMVGYSVAGLVMDVPDPTDFETRFYRPQVKLRDAAGNELLYSSGGLDTIPADDGTVTLRGTVGYGFDQFVTADDPAGIADDYLAAVYGGDLPGVLDMIVEIDFVLMNVSTSIYEEVPGGSAEFALMVPLQPGRVLTPGLTETQQDINVTLESLRITPSQTKAQICYDLPDSRDWQPEAALMIGDVPGRITGWGMTNLPTAQDVTRCFDLRFDAIHSGNPAVVTLTLERLRVSVPETPEFWNDVREGLLPLGIEIEVHLSRGQAYRIVSAPEGLDQIEQGRIIQDVVRRLSPTVEGPWVFVVDLER